MKLAAALLPAPVSSSRHDAWQRYPATLFHIIGYSAFRTGCVYATNMISSHRHHQFRIFCWHACQIRPEL